jgi:hypothetical protein
LHAVKLVMNSSEIMYVLQLVDILSTKFFSNSKQKAKLVWMNKNTCTNKLSTPIGYCRFRRIMKVVVSLNSLLWLMMLMHQK